MCVKMTYWLVEFLPELIFLPHQRLNSLSCSWIFWENLFCELCPGINFCSVAIELFLNIGGQDHCNSLQPANV